MNRRFLLFTCISMLCLLANAQSKLDRKYRVSAKLGGASYTQSDMNATFGATIGGGVEFDITRNTALLTGLNLAKRGGEGSSSIGLLEVSAYYLEIPVEYRFYNFFSRIDEWDSVDLFVAISSHLSCGLFGRSNANAYTKTSTSGGEYREEQIEAISQGTFSSSGIRRFDVGIGAKMGVVLSDHYECSIGADIGLINVKGPVNGHNFQVFVGLAYLW